MNIIGISGSLRKSSYNKRLLHIARDLMPSDMKMEIVDLSPLPMYNWDIEQEGLPEAVVALREKIEKADGLLIATPEYNYSITGALKNAIDWLSRRPSVLSGKPMAMMGVGGRSGTLLSQHHLRQIAVNTNMITVTQPQVLIAMTPLPAFDKDGNLTDEMSLQLIKDLNQALYTLILQRQATQQNI